ncbi:MAG: NAD(P)/FAD-dependent oxidoreductase [Chloroflexota bacterium]|nr:NAD(P)/FAD-dependent oxidoreductase [Chloroflexota bacterium]
MRKMTTGAPVAAGVAAAGAAARLAATGRKRRRHESETEAAYRTAAHRVLILGGGFGGLATALELDRRIGRRPGTSVLVADRDNNLLFTPLLWTVADGRAGANNVTVPIRAFQRDRAFHVLHAEVQAIDLNRREVRTSAGARPYDVLVIALGSVTAVPDLPGLRERALQFATPSDAIELRNHLIDAIEAAHQTDNPAERQEWLTCVVGGGGDTGIELAATIHQYIFQGLLAEYPWLSDAPVKVVVVGRANRLVPMSNVHTSSAVERLLREEGVDVLTGASIDSVTDRAVMTSRGEIPARTLFWAAGISAPPVVRALPVEHARNGAIVVDSDLRVPGHPEVYVVGDSAWAFDSDTGKPVPPTAQAAGHEGEYVGMAIAERLAGRQPPKFRFKTRGHLALLGGRSGVAEIGNRTITGFPAWLLWHAYYLARIPSWLNRTRLALDWLLAGLTGRETGQLRLGPNSASGRTAPPATTG